MTTASIILASAVSTGSAFEPVEFSGFDLLKFYFYLVENFFEGYSWQMAMSYNLTLLSVLTLLVLFVLFWYRVWKHRRRTIRKEKLSVQYADKFRMILGSADELTRLDVLNMLGKTDEEVRSSNPYYYAQMLEKVRMEMYEIVYLPNMQTLAETLGVTEHFERSLLMRRDVFRTLQMMLMLQLTITEGRLANYVNHSNPEIRMMARLNYITCSSNEPYRYLLEDLNQEQSLYRPMILNYVFGWMMFKNRHMPNFLILSEQVENEDSAAYMVRMVAFWGNENEKESVKELFLAKRMKVRSAAINVVAILQDSSAENLLVDSYFHQPESIRREILKALLAIGSGKQTEFFKRAYELSSTRQTREVALHCLYNYGNEGRRLFEIMRHEADDDTRRLIDQVDSFALLQTLQSL